MFFFNKGKELDLSKWVTDEGRSNPMVVAQCYPTCPINEVCTYIVVGFGSIAKQCPSLKISRNGEKVYCKKM